MHRTLTGFIVIGIVMVVVVAALLPRIWQFDKARGGLTERSIKSLVSEIQTASTLPIYLPTHLPDGADDLRLIDAGKDHYVVQYSTEGNCDGGACHLGYIQAERVDTASLHGDEVTLEDGTTAYFRAPVCGANCDDAELSWVKDGVAFTISEKAGELDSLRETAASALKNGIVSPSR
jgi:hypothetical protein